MSETKMNGDFKPHFDAIHQWIDAQRELLSPVPKISPDERKEQQHAVDRSMNQLTKVGVSIPEDQQVLRLELAANKGSVAATDVVGQTFLGRYQWRGIQADCTKVSLEEIRSRYIAERKKP